jgi:hypothetical protein
MKINVRVQVGTSKPDGFACGVLAGARNSGALESGSRVWEWGVVPWGERGLIGLASSPGAGEERVRCD